VLDPDRADYDLIGRNLVMHVTVQHDAHVLSNWSTQAAHEAAQVFFPKWTFR
jgi:hypothetical protein